MTTTPAAIAAVSADRPHVVGLGASTGGLEALKAFFGAMPPATGVAFVVVVHLEPVHQGLLSELIGHASGLTVVQAEDGQPVAADHVYVIPPSGTLTLRHGCLHVRTVADPRGLRGVIDTFFRSLAEDQHDRAVGVVLSGPGTEGTLGVRAIKAEGGLTVAQAPDTAVEPDMPTSAIATGLIDVVGAPATLPAALLAYLRNPLVKRATAPEPPPLDGLATILSVLRARTTHDFRGYRKDSLQRRVERRMGLHHLGTVDQYVDLLRAQPAEADRLVKDFRVGVTAFFREPRALDELATTAVATLAPARVADTPLRIWVPGCSIGEEAYSVAMVVAEQLAAAQASRVVQIFATDMDADALAVARAGTYPDSIALDVSPQRLQRFFTPEAHRYTIAAALRESMVFAVHDLTSDPPFSKLDLIICRNVLSGLEPDAQARLLRQFHCSLNPDGCLLLGSADGVGALNDLFTPLSTRHRLFRRVAPAGQVVRFYGALERHITLPTGDTTLDAPPNATELHRTPRLPAFGVALLAPGEMATLLNEIVRAALDVTHADMAHLQLAGDDGTLTIAAQSGFDQPFLDHFARANAHTDCICGRALAKRTRLTIDDIPTTPLLADAGTLAAFHAAGVRALQSTPLLSSSERLIGMLSTHYRAPHAFDAADGRWLDWLAVRATTLIERAQREDQLRDVQRGLEQRVIEHTGDLRDALDGAQAGIWHIDLRAMTITRDERARAMVGATTLTCPFDPTFPEVHPDDRARLQAEFAALQEPGSDRWEVEFRIVRPNGATVWVHRVGRFTRDADGRPLEFRGIKFDITERKRAEAALIESRRQEQETGEALASLFAAAAEGILALDSHGMITQANPALHEMFGYPPGELIGRPLEGLIPEDRRSVHAVHHAAFWTSRASRRMGAGRGIVGRTKDGTTFPVEISLTRVATPPPDGRVFAIVSDISVRTRAEAEAQRAHDELHHRTNQLRRMAVDLAVAEQRTREQLARTLHDGLQQLLFAAKLRLERLGAASSAGAGPAAQWSQVKRDVDEAIAAARTLAVELYPPPLHTGGLVAAVTWLARWMEERYGLRVDLTADPEATLDRPEQKDRLMLVFESLRELLFDVVKHAQVDRATVDLTLTPDSQLQITVADHGVGFDATAALAQASTTSGWGLFRIRERADLLGGSLQIASAPGQGTRFVFTMPRGEAAPVTARTLRVLIADDHLVARAGLRELLTARPELEIVGEASTGFDAVAQAEALRPDAVVMDVSMPGLDGVEATRRIHAAAPAIQILGLSSHTEGADAFRAAGAVGYFTKGDDPQLLIDRLLALHAARMSTPTSS